MERKAFLKSLLGLPLLFLLKSKEIKKITISRPSSPSSSSSSSSRCSYSTNNKYVLKRGKYVY